MGVDPESRVRVSPKLKPKINPTKTIFSNSRETTTHAQRFTRLTTDNSIGNNTGGGGRER